MEENNVFNNNKKFTSFDLMKIFGIKKGSWFNVKSKFNLDQYSERILDGKKEKFVYNEEAYNILKENYRQKVVKEVKENPKMFSLIQENETLKATVSEYKSMSIKFEKISTKFEKLYQEEKEARLQEIENSHKKELEIVDLKKDLEVAKSNWTSSANQNSEFQQEINKLKEENEKLKKRGFFARLFNRGV